MDAQIYSGAFLDSKRTIGDLGADDFIRRFFSDPKQKAELFDWLHALKQNSSLDTISKTYSSEDFIKDIRQLPHWADKVIMRRGSTFFVRYSEQIMQLMGLLSLPYCYAAADGAMVLYLSQRLKDQPAKRLSDTAEFIWDVMSPVAFEPEGKGFTSCLKIRLGHAAARYYTLNRGNWDDKLGVPINQEDMAGTNLSFSLVVVRGLRKLGYAVSYDDQQAFMHLWNVVGTLLGLEDDLIPQNGKSANALEKAIRERHFKASPHGRELTASLINYFADIPGLEVSGKQTGMLMRFLLGDEVADILDISKTAQRAYLTGLLKLKANLPDFKGDEPVLLKYNRKYLEFSRGTIS